MSFLALMLKFDVYKKCSICKKRKKLSAFNRNRTRKDDLSNVCRECSKKRSKQYYADNKESHKQVIKKRKEKFKEINRKYVINYLLNNPCIECGEKNPLVLDFDHVRGKKVDNISQMITKPTSLNTIKVEIKKCEVMCAKCHRIKTALENGNWKVKFLKENDFPHFLKTRTLGVKVAHESEELRVGVQFPQCPSRSNRDPNPPNVVYSTSKLGML